MKLVYLHGGKKQKHNWICNLVMTNRSGFPKAKFWHPWQPLSSKEIQEFYLRNKKRVCCVNLSYRYRIFHSWARHSISFVPLLTAYALMWHEYIFNYSGYSWPYLETVRFKVLFLFVCNFGPSLGAGVSHCLCWCDRKVLLGTNISKNFSIVN